MMMLVSQASRTLVRGALRGGPRALGRVRVAGGPRVLPASVAVAPVRRAFSYTPLARGQGETDPDLSEKLATELGFERDNSNLFGLDGRPTQEPQFLQEFKAQGIWKLVDDPAADEVVLEREFGNEHVKVVFSIGDIESQLSEPEEGELDGSSNDTANSSADNDEQTPEVPIRICVQITKPNTGALTIDATVQDGNVTIDSISHYTDANLATAMSAQADFERRGVYLGPHFETLDESLQTSFEAYLAERGIDSNLALFIPTFAEYKEQREYCSWLQNVRNFVDA
ncbi:mitochondrial glyco protein [Testicularia cyperi]|uniref:Mitochondrial glyco protein n=1 Tax=Testicularia cyperi TaxID=1882483 RepID=A0A317XK29_9BASI|nr:mitochondrial glyco protein [Testicularia cyperi]